MPFQIASKSLVAPTSAASSLPGHIGAWLLAQPMLVAPAARSAIAPRPWASSRWCIAGSASKIMVPPGRVLAGAVAEEPRDVGLVDRHPVRHAVGEALADDRGVVREPVDGGPVQPAAVVLERLRQVPVVERDHRLDARLEQAVDEAVVEVEARRVHRPLPGRLDPRPGHRHPVPAGTEAPHQGDVLGVAVVVVGGHVAGAAVRDPSRLADERVPDAGSAAVLARRPLDLVRRSTGSEAEAGGS